MSRTLAQALALVNWRGVFYERYQLDRHVTALEGANGAGKTTVMIAAYIVLLPDMSRLRFTNLGETGATGGDKGIWGRLGAPGRPSYAALDFALPAGRRLIAGVHLERKGEPSVEPTPFIVAGLADDVRLQDLLLVTQGEDEAVPELPELRENAARLGGRLQSFTTARDYFAALFDQGVTPLRLTTDEERGKLNEMLRTSMTGGISRALTSELRDFLLKEEGGLSDTLQRMKANLDSCRRTRTEVQESRRLEQEIGGVFEAGQRMFDASFLATRERADELTRRVADAESAWAAARDAQAAADGALASTTAELATLDLRRDEIGGALESARQWRERMRVALDAAGELARCAAALQIATSEERTAAASREQAQTARDQRREALRRAEEDYRHAASGLADMQSGIEELYRRAGAFQQAQRRLREAERLLEFPVPTEQLDERLVQVRTDLARVDQERRAAQTRLDDADEHRRRHGQVLAALRALVADEVRVEDAADVAADALRRHRDRVAQAERVPWLAEQLAEARTLVERQMRIRTRAAQLDVDTSTGSAGTVVRRLLDEAEMRLQRMQEDERTTRSELALAQDAAKALEARRMALVASEPQWRELAACAARLARFHDAPVTGRDGLDAARNAIGAALSAARKAEETMQEKQEQLVREARDLLAAGGPFTPELLHLRDELGAELMATSFEDVSLHEAGRVEALLGPLAQALVVDEPRAAAQAIQGRSEVLPDVLLLERGTELEALTSLHPGEAGAVDVVVDEGLALRVSRVPARPRIGRRAREARAAELRAEADASARELEDLRARRRQFDRLALDGETLLAGHAVWLAGDPAPELAELRRLMTDAANGIERLRDTLAQQTEAVRQLRPRVDGLRDLLAEAFLLDPPDHAERARALAAEHAAALFAKTEVARLSHHVEAIEADASVLRTPPLSAAEYERLRLFVETLRQQREALQDAAEALEYVQANSAALGWSEAPARLSASRALVPALESQLRETEAARATAETAVANAEQHFDAARTHWQDMDARRVVASEQHMAASARFESLGIPAPTGDALRAADGEVVRIEEELRGSEERYKELLKAQGRQEGECTESRQRTQTAEEKLASERREAQPAVERWERLHKRALEHGLLTSSTAFNSDLASLRGSPNLRQAAQTQRTLLLERLGNARGGEALLAHFEVLQDISETALDEACFELWLRARDWLHSRLPAQVAEVSDPREALLRLRDQLTSLEERLARQESDLRGASEDVARGIDVQVRKARGQVSRLNKNLEGISFGSIQGIRVRLNSIEKMEQVLRALREGAAQDLLFQANMPIEEALEEIFRRHGGGRTGGQRLLDYREYVHLQVEIRRKAGTDWEIANPTRLSTGEAIGVGAALMMVVLTEWERDATLLRGRRSHGSLRFLFLDEANRLSHDNLGVLFDLCQTLDLQLLIAAPEVARAEGNTTYRLVRRALPNGDEEVIVSGRRTRAQA